jgi:hypothetical protein
MFGLDAITYIAYFVDNNFALYHMFLGIGFVLQAYMGGSRLWLQRRYPTAGHTGRFGAWKERVSSF